MDHAMAVTELHDGASDGDEGGAPRWQGRGGWRRFGDSKGEATLVPGKRRGLGVREDRLMGTVMGTETAMGRRHRL